MTDWFYKDGSRIFGPLPETMLVDMLRYGLLQPSTHVRRANEKAWHKAESVSWQEKSHGPLHTRAWNEPSQSHSQVQPSNAKRHFGKFVLWLIVIGVLAIAITPALRAKGIEVTNSAYGEGWPFPKHSTGIIRCENKTMTDLIGRSVIRPAVSIELDGKRYGLNAPGIQLYGDPEMLRPRNQNGFYKPETVDAMAEFVKMGLARCS